MSKSNDLSNIIKDCITIFDENIAILSDITSSLNLDMEDCLIPIVDKAGLTDMVHEVADSVKIKKAEYDFMKRHFKSD